MRTPPLRPTSLDFTVPVLTILFLLAWATPAGASGFERFQRGGRGVGQAGALVARADDPSAIHYNPAGLADLEGWQLVAGVDLGLADDVYRERFEQIHPLTGERRVTSGSFDADHDLDALPVVYLTWNDPQRLGPWSFGLGVDSPVWYRVEWDDPDFPLADRTRVSALELWQLHPVAAYRLGGGWSVGGGLRYLYGTHRRGNDLFFLVAGTDDATVRAELSDDYEADVDGVGFDLGVRYAAAAWGVGLVYRSAVEVEGSDRQRYTLRAPVGDPVARRNLETLLDQVGDRPFTTRLDLPAEVAAGVWVTLLPELRVELDVVATDWSSFEERRDGLDLSRNPFPFDVLVDGWDDTLSLRLGAEWHVTEGLALSGGVAREESPVPETFLSPDWFRGDATVWSVGASFMHHNLSVDLGYSYHDLDTARHTFVLPRLGSRASAYASDAQVGSVTLRTRI